MKIYERQYDNPLDKDGKPKSNELIGDFEIIETLFEDFYAGQWIGEMDGKIYLITQTEVSGMNGSPFAGSRFEVKEILKLTLRQPEKNKN